MLKTTLALLFVAALLGACSDDDEKPKDQGIKQDQGIADKGIVADKGTGDTTIADKGTTDAPAKKKVEEYLPKDNDITGWTEDTSVGQPGVESGYTKLAIEALINGKHDPYHAQNCDAFAMEQYKKTFDSTCSAALEIMIWECTTSTGSKFMYDKDKTDSGLTWAIITGVKDEGVMADDSPLWRSLAYKGPYIMKIDSTPTAPSCRPALKTDVESFVKNVTGKLP